MRLIDLYSSIRADQYIKIYEHSKKFADKHPPKLLYKGRVSDFSQAMKSEGKNYIRVLQDYTVGSEDISIEYDSYHPYIKIMVERNSRFVVRFVPPSTHGNSTNETKDFYRPWPLSDFSNYRWYYHELKIR